MEFSGRGGVASTRSSIYPVGLASPIERARRRGRGLLGAYRMDAFEEIQDLARRAARLNLIEPTLPPGADDAEIAGLEIRTGLPLPPAFREWLKFTNGPVIGAGGVYGVQTGRSFTDIESFYDWYTEWRGKGWIPIAGDGCGDYYVIATREHNSQGRPVFFIDCHLDPLEPAYIVASNVLSFLRFYLRADLGERGWPFDRAKMLAEDPAIAEATTADLPWEAD